MRRIVENYSPRDLTIVVARYIVTNTSASLIIAGTAGATPKRQCRPITRATLDRSSAHSTVFVEAGFSAETLTELRARSLRADTCFPKLFPIRSFRSTCQHLRATRRAYGSFGKFSLGSARRRTVRTQIRFLAATAEHSEVIWTIFQYVKFIRVHTRACVKPY